MVDKRGRETDAVAAGLLSAVAAPPDLSSADAVLGRIAQRRAGVFTREDAIAAGLPAREVDRRLRRGQWVRLFGAALRAATTPDSIDARERAALVRAGGDAVLSHFSAARRWRLGVSETESAPVWVTVPHHRSPRPIAGVRLVRSRHLDSSMVRRIDGLAVLSVARTIADLAEHMTQRRLTAVALDALQRRLCTHDELAAMQRALPGRRRASVFAGAVRAADPALESILAAEFGQLMLRANVPVVAGYRLRLPGGDEVLCDFADIRARIDFEVDGFAYHSSPAQVARDKERDRRLARAGWLTVRYGTDDVRRRPTDTLADVLRQIAARLP